MRFELLGPLRVVEVNNGVPTALTVLPRKVANLLAVLLVRANQVVSADQLIAELWGEHPPRRAMATLHVYVSQLRRYLAIGGVNPITTQGRSYCLTVDPGDCDIDEFRTLTRAGRTHLQAGRHSDASAALSQARALWRGPALAEAGSGPILTGFTVWLEELRQEGQEMLIEAGLAMGCERELVSSLYAMIAENPLHEVYYRQLMTALYRCDRRAEALTVYRKARARITDDLGLEPGRPLQLLHQEILAADIDLRARPIAV
jgi:DNA-binding SARP family transcriptional activator